MLIELQWQADQLEAFLQGELDPSIDPRPLLEIDFADLGEFASSSRRRKSFLGPDAVEEVRVEPGEGDLDAQLDAARRRRISLWRQFVGLDEDVRRALFANHVERSDTTSEALVEQIAQAEDAAKEAAEQREKALVDSQLARTEALRLIADRRAGLLSLKEAQARFEAELASRRAEIDAAMESALAWNRRVRELQEAPPAGTARANEADGLYKMLTKDLSDARRNLGLALDAVRSEPSGVPMPPEVDPDPIPADIDDGTIRELRSELTSSALKLQAAETQLRWDRAAGLRDVVVIMNQSRLRLFDMLSESRRDSLEGFGAEGVAQVKRELKQIILETRFHLLSLPREAARQYHQLRSAPGPAFTGLFQLALLLVIFQWWRKRANSTLEQMRRTWLQKRPQTQLTRGVAAIIWYLRRVRKPLEWLVFFALLVWLIGRAGQMAGTKYFEIIILWLLTGAFVVELIDATASRQGFSSESSAKLRFRSLRMVGVSVVTVGLILSLTVATVGKGAIYAWVISTFWFLAIPVVLVLVFWWKDTIFERAQSRESSRLLQWVATQDEGVLKYPAAAIGGAYLLIEGIAAFFVRRVGELAPLRRFFAYLFRRGVEKSTSATPPEYGTEPIPAEAYDALAPRPADTPELVTSYMSDRIHAMRSLVRSDNHAIVAVVGERGLGKTTFLNRVTNGVEPDGLCFVQCQPGGFSMLLREFARVLELPESATEGEIIASLRERAPGVICVDDAQRLVRPLIGGLEDIDHLIRFTRLVSPNTSWLIAIGVPAWQYLRRARGDRAAFDQIIELDPWEEAQIATLVEQRTAAAGIVPDFERLVVPRQVQTSPVSDE
ncbi:MAG: ATP-binding protein, partial [Myxococcales bacterium]|nr:ATP-binding protein [Myxococcales bacterium]